MAIPKTSDSIGNELRLSGLKNVSGRRKVLPGAEYLHDLDQVDTDVSGASQPEENLPQLEMGAELSPQSFDVRANKVMLPQPQVEQQMPQDQEESIWTRFGRALGMRSQGAGEAPNEQAIPQAPPVETQEVDLQEGLPPVSLSQQEYRGPQAPESSPGIWGAISDYFNPKKIEEMGGYNSELRKDAQLRSKGLEPGAFRAQEEEQLAQQAQIDQESLDMAQEAPWEVVAYGATDAFAQQPELLTEFKEYTGMDFTPEIKEMTEKYEKVLSDIEKGYDAADLESDDQEKRIAERIQRNESTDADKFYIGLALLMPLLVGGLFGKEAGLAALGGGAKGFADILGRKQKDVREDEQLLADVRKQKQATSVKKGELEIERLKIPAQIKKLIPEDELKDLKGMNIVKLKEPNGEVIGAGPEVFPDLVANLSYYNTPKKREKMTEEAQKLNSDKKFLKQANNATKHVIDAAKQLDDPSWFAKALAIGMSEGIDAGGVSLGANSIKKIYRQNAPMIKDENGRSVNAAVYLDSKIEQIKDAYRRNEQMRAFTQTVASHIGSMAENPLYSGLTADDLITQMLILRDRSQQIYVDAVEGSGFYPQPIVQEIGKQNREIYKGLNRRAELGELEADKQKLLKGE